MPKQVTEEPERIRKWREEQKARLEEKDREEERKKEELREQARKELEDWYKHHEEAISKTKAANRWIYPFSLFYWYFLKAIQTLTSIANVLRVNKRAWNAVEMFYSS